METPNYSEPTPSREPYEFDASQNKVIGDLASAMQWVAIPLIVVGIIYAFSAVAQFVASIGDWRGLFPAFLVALGAVLYLVLGIWTRQASQSFNEVVTTSGRDIGHLMSALDSLRKKYSLLSFIVKLYIAFLIIGLIIAIVLWVSGSLNPPGV